MICERGDIEIKLEMGMQLGCKLREIGTCKNLWMKDQQQVLVSLAESLMALNTGTLTTEANSMWEKGASNEAESLYASTRDGRRLPTVALKFTTDVSVALKLGMCQTKNY